jgi:hypothetical protein
MATEGSVLDQLVDAIRESCTPRIWSKGVELARSGAVAGQAESGKEVVLKVAVAGQAVAPTVTLLPLDQDWSCACGGRDDPCSHVAGAAIAFRRAQKDGRSLAVSSLSPAHVGYHFESVGDQLSFRRVLIAGGTAQALNHSLVDERAKIGVAATREDLAVERAMDRRLGGGVLPEGVLGAVLRTLQGMPQVQLDGKDTEVGAPEHVLCARIEDAGDGFWVQLDSRPAIERRYRNGAVVLTGRLCPIATLELKSGQREQLLAGVRFPAAMAGKLVAELLPTLQAQIPISIRTGRLPRGEAEPPRLVIETERSGQGLRIHPTIVYGDPERARVVADRLTLSSTSTTVPLRDEGAEARLRHRLETTLGIRVDRSLTFERDEARSFITRLHGFREAELRGGGIHAFRDVGPLFPSLTIDGDRVQLAFRGQGTCATAGDARTVLAAWAAGERSCLLELGGVGQVPGEWLDEHGHRLATILDLVRADGTIEPCGRPDLARLCQALDYPPPAMLTEVQRALGPDGLTPSTFELPQHLCGVLRTYQATGARWLDQMRRLRLGALLADDMGLGKTLQVLAVIGHGRTLVVAPTSVLKNWATEAKRFQPALTVSIYHGTERSLDHQAQLVITTYAILRRDVDQLCSSCWDAVVLDESQLIKNPESAVAQAAFRLEGRWRVALSGTPVENRLDDLWSQFHFLNRGLLGGRATFRDRYAQPIAEGQGRVASELQDRISPFVLRRLKSAVATELPPRTEVVLRCQLRPAERELYQSILAATRSDVLGKLKGGGSVLAVLEALLRLRQAACHPALVPGQRAETSSKLRLLLQTLDQAIGEGHKSLVFSQWTALLDLVEPHLRRREIEFLRLDGSTRDRQSVVDSFQNEGSAMVLLISLRAGGVGLNLTAADHVFHLDSWWNPAVEEQAADRAHRIGQTKPVSIYRLIAEETVEERILALQARKRHVAQVALAQAGDKALLTREDLLALLA